MRFLIYVRCWSGVMPCEVERIRECARVQVGSRFDAELLEINSVTTTWILK